MLQRLCVLIARGHVPPSRSRSQYFRCAASLHAPLPNSHSAVCAAGTLDAYDARRRRGLGRVDGSRGVWKLLRSACSISHAWGGSTRPRAVWKCSVTSRAVCRGVVGTVWEGVNRRCGGNARSEIRAVPYSFSSESSRGWVSLKDGFWEECDVINSDAANITLKLADGSSKTFARKQVRACAYACWCGSPRGQPAPAGKCPPHQYKLRPFHCCHGPYAECECVGRVSGWWGCVAVQGSGLEPCRLTDSPASSHVPVGVG